MSDRVVAQELTAMIDLEHETSGVLTMAPRARVPASIVDMPVPRALPEKRRRMRIAIVSPEVGPGAGVPHYWQALANVMAKHHEVHVFTARASGASLKNIRLHRVWAVFFGWFLLHATFYFAVRCQFFLQRMLSRKKFDLILGIGALTPFADIATAHFVQARELDLQKQGLFPRERAPKGLLSLDYALYSRTMSALGGNFYRQSEMGIVAISAAVKQDLVLFEGARADAITVVPNGVDTVRFNPANRELFRKTVRKELGITEEQTMLLFVGNSWGRKGLRTAIEAIQGPGQEDVRLVVVGEGVRDVFLDSLPPQLVNRILFTGKQNEHVERFYAAADVFILPTLYEPFGLVILEALASGLPTIVSACAGASEWLVDGLDAILLQDASDGSEARAALHRILTEPDLASYLAKNGRKRAEELHWGAVADRIIDAFEVRSEALQSKTAMKEEASQLLAE